MKYKKKKPVPTKPPIILYFERDVMSVYVDEMSPSIPNANWRYSEACHLVADSVEELHEFAQGIGLKRSWFQLKTIPHYDLTRNTRRKALRYGARTLGMREFAEYTRSYKT